MTDERFKAWLNFSQFILGTVVLGIVSIAISNQIQTREVEIKEQDANAKFLEQALQEDVGVRRRFAQYFSHVTRSSELRSRWGEYAKLVETEYQETLVEKKRLEQEAASKPLDAASKDRLFERIAQLERALSPRLSSDRDNQEKVYESVKIEGLTANKTSYVQGEEVKVYYDLVNWSETTLVIPENIDYSRSFHLLGTIQHWIQRLGPDSIIPSIPDKIEKRGARYGAGGTIVPAGTALKPFERMPIHKTIDTTGYPSGRYRFYAEYKELIGSLIQIATVDFTIE